MSPEIKLTEFIKTVAEPEIRKIQGFLACPACANEKPNYVQATKATESRCDDNYRQFVCDDCSFPGESDYLNSHWNEDLAKDRARQGWNIAVVGALKLRIERSS